jgi:hypothetical protein
MQVVASAAQILHKAQGMVLETDQQVAAGRVRKDKGVAVQEPQGGFKVKSDTRIILRREYA